LAEALRDEKKLFSDFEVELISVGEESGHLDISLLSVAEWLEMMFKVKREVLGGLLYPAFLLHAAVAASRIVPFVLGHLSGQAYLMRSLGTLFWFYVVFFGLFFVLPRIRRRLSATAFLVDSLLLMIPVLRTVMVKLALARFAQAFKCVIVAGVPVVHGLDRASWACGNQVIGARLRKAIPRLKKGMGIADSLARTRVFPVMGIEFIRTGEESGNMDKMLGKISQIFASDAQFAIEQGARWLPRIMYLGAAVYVAHIIIQLYSGVYAGYEDLLKDLPI